MIKRLGEEDIIDISMFMKEKSIGYINTYICNKLINVLDIDVRALKKMFFDDIIEVYGDYNNDELEDIVMFELNCNEKLTFANIIFFPNKIENNILQNAILQLQENNPQILKVKMAIENDIYTSGLLINLGFQYEICIREFIDNNKNIDSYAYYGFKKDRAKKDAYPIFLKDSIKIIRVDENGDVIAISKKLNMLGEISINKTAFDILELCNGENTIEDIITALRHTYAVPEKTNLFNSIDKILKRMWHSGCLIISGYDYIKADYSQIESDFEINYMSYNDLRTFLDELSDINAKNIYMNPYRDNNLILFNEDSLKLLYFIFKERYFQVKKKNKTIAIIGLQYLTIPQKYNITFWKFDLEFSDEQIKGLLYNIHQINAYVNKEIGQQGYINNELLEFQYVAVEKESINGFSCRGELRKEFNGNSLYMHVLIISKCNEIPK